VNTSAIVTMSAFRKASEIQLKRPEQRTKFDGVLNALQLVEPSKGHVTVEISQHTITFELHEEAEYVVVSSRFHLHKVLFKNTL
jgi:hypothetical protein